MKNDLNELAQACYKNSKDKGFWDDYLNTIKRMELAKDGEGQLIFNSEDILAVATAFSSQRLMHIASELGETMEAKRGGLKSHWGPYLAELDNKGVDFDPDLFKKYIKDSVGDELADVLILALGTSAGEGINIGKHVEHKMKYNLGRPVKHAKEF